MLLDLLRKILGEDLFYSVLSTVKRIVIVSFIVIVGISLLTALIELLGYTLEMQ